VRGANQDVAGGYPRHASPHAIRQHRGKPQQIEGDDCHGRLIALKHHGPGRELTALLVRRRRGSQATGYWQQRLGGDRPPSRTHLQLRRRGEVVHDQSQAKKHHQQEAQQHRKALKEMMAYSTVG
jgi:hypothetical protein